MNVKVICSKVTILFSMGAFAVDLSSSWVISVTWRLVVSSGYPARSLALLDQHWDGWPGVSILWLGEIAGWPATSIWAWMHVHSSEQILPWDTLMLGCWAANKRLLPCMLLRTLKKLWGIQQSVDPCECWGWCPVGNHLGLVVRASASRVADLGLIPTFTVDLFPDGVIPVT